MIVKLVDKYSLEDVLIIWSHKPPSKQFLDITRFIQKKFLNLTQASIQNNVIQRSETFLTRIFLTYDNIYHICH